MFININHLDIQGVASHISDYVWERISDYALLDLATKSTTATSAEVCHAVELPCHHVVSLHQLLPEAGPLWAEQQGLGWWRNCSELCAERQRHRILLLLHSRRRYREMEVTCLAGSLGEALVDFARCHVLYLMYRYIGCIHEISKG